MLVVVVFALAGVAWIALTSWHAHAPGAGSSTGHDMSAAQPMPATTGDRLAGWVLMVVAMMLPPALPLLRVVRRLVARHRRPVLLVAATAAAFLLVWVAAGAGYVIADIGWRALADRLPPLAAHPQVVAGAAAVGAGLYQFTPLKNACLTACRSPVGLALSTWTGTRAAGTEAALIGLRFGLVCVGCCWALMLLTGTVGVAAMPVMVVLAAVMAAERLLPRVRRFVPVVALAAIGLGVLLLVGVVPPGPIASR